MIGKPIVAYPTALLRACERARDALNASTWASVHDCLMHPRAHTASWRERAACARHVSGHALFESMPWCYEPNSRVRTTFISC